MLINSTSALNFKYKEVFIFIIVAFLFFLLEDHYQKEGFTEIVQ